MTTKEKMEILADVLDIDVEELSVDTLLADLDEWDSLAALSLIVVADEKFGKKLSGTQVKSFERVQDILDFMG